MAGLVSNLNGMRETSLNIELHLERQLLDPLCASAVKVKSEKTRFARMGIPMLVPP